MKNLFKAINAELQAHRNERRADEMSAYMRNQFIYFGINSPKRKEIQKLFFTPRLVSKSSEIKEFVSLCWAEDQREWKYVALEFSQKYVKGNMNDLLPFFEELVTDQSWWDTVDSIAPNLLGLLLREDHYLRIKKQNQWIESDNFWLQRTAIILQLKYKAEVDFETLKELILRRARSQEFFIRKAIGWSLREYSKVNPKAVTQFVKQNELSPLSKREALRLMVNSF